MTLRRDARRVKDAGRRLVALLCLGGLLEACQWLLVFTPEASAADGGALSDAMPEAATADVVVADTALAEGATDAGGAQGCAARADAAFCVDFSSDADLAPDAWLNLDPNIRLSTTEGVTSPPSAARMETTTSGGSCAYQFLNHVLEPRATMRVRFVANVSSTTEGFPIAMSLLQGGDDAVILGGIFKDRLQILVQQAATGDTSASGPPIQTEAVHAAELVVFRTTLGGPIEVTFRLLDMPQQPTAKLELSASLSLGHVAIILGVWNQCNPTVVTADDVAVWFD